jgi:hypothetical protein
MGELTAENNWIQLNIDGQAHAGLSIHPEDGDFFSRSRKMLDRTGRLGGRPGIFEGQLASLKRELEAWSTGYADSVEETYLVLKGGEFLFLVILKGKAYDGALEDSLTDLDMKVAQNPAYDLINLSVMAFPAFAEDAIRSFLPDRVGPRGAGGHAE